MVDFIESQDKIIESIRSLQDNPQPMATLGEKARKLFSNKNYQPEDLELIYFFIKSEENSKLYSNRDKLISSLRESIKKSLESADVQYSESLNKLLNHWRSSKKNKISGRLGTANSELRGRFSRLNEVGIIVKKIYSSNMRKGNKEITFDSPITSHNKFYTIDEDKFLQEFNINPKTFSKVIASMIFKKDKKELYSISSKKLPKLPN